MFELIVGWFTTWVAGKAFGFLVKTIISEDFLKDLVKDYGKDFFKFVFNNAVTAPFQQEPLQKAKVMAVAEFLQLIQQDLEDGELSEDDIKKYSQPIKHFLKNQEVKEILGNAFKYENQENQVIDTKRLQEIWDELNSSCLLPDDFNWKRVGKKYVQKVKEIILEVPELREILDSQNLDKIRENTQEMAGIIPEFDLERYQESIRERYGNLKLDSLDTSGYAYNELKLWGMFIAQNVREVHQVLPQVHELPKEHLRRLRESEQLEAEIALEELERHKRVYLEQPLCSVLDIVNDRRTYKYIVILGDPGSGKSTLLQYLALNWAESPLNNVISLPIPLLIELRTYMRRRDDKECHNFLDFFHKCSGAISHLNQHQLHEQLKAGHAVVMFDGLDEVFDPGQREDVITDIHRFTNEYPNVQVIVTSRVIGYKPQRLRDAEFRHFMLQDLEPEQIQDFIYRWHELTFKDAGEKERKKERLQKGINDSKAIAELAGNPLLLTMMAILNRNQELPRDRAELYNQASRVLLHQWDVERALVEDKRLDPKTIDYKDKQAMLRQVAYYMQTSEKGLAGNLISADDLEKNLIDYLKTIEVSQAREVARVMMHQLRTRNFMLCFLGADYYAFVHRTFLEYFCAWEFVWQFEKTRKLNIEQLKQEVFGKHWHDETWHEVLLLISGMIDGKFVGEILEYLMEQNGEDEKFINLFLAARCFAEVRNPVVIKSVEEKLLNQLKGLIKYDLPYYYKGLKEINLVEEIRTQAVATIATTWQNSPDTVSWLKDSATNDENYKVRGVAVRELARGFQDDPDTLSFLKHLSTNDENYKVRGVAVRELAREFKHDPETVCFLKHLSTNDDDNDVRVVAVQELARGFQDDPDTLSFLKHRATNNENSYVRGVVVQELARGFQDDPDTLNFLKHLSINDDDNDVRVVAVQELARGFQDDPETVCFLKHPATNDDDSYVRRVAVQELGKNFKYQPELFDIYYNCAVNDPFKHQEDYGTNPRRIALEIIIKQFPQHPQTLPLLRDRAENDPDEKVREYAQEKLKEWA